MKTLLLIIVLLNNVSFADEPKCTEESEHVVDHTLKDINSSVPNFLKGAKIIVRKADGTETVVPAERFKVVPRKQQFIVDKFLSVRTLTCTSNFPSKNRVSVLGGHGRKDGLKTNTSPTNVTIENKTGFVGGAQYQRMLNDTLSVGAQVQSNKTGSLMLGVDF